MAEREYGMAYGMITGPVLVIEDGALESVIFFDNNKLNFIKTDCLKTKLYLARDLRGRGRGAGACSTGLVLPFDITVTIIIMLITMIISIVMAIIMTTIMQLPVVFLEILYFCQ